MWQSLHKAHPVNRNCFAWWDSVGCDKPWGAQLWRSKICGLVIFDITLRLSSQVDQRNDGPGRGINSEHTSLREVGVYSFKVSCSIPHSYRRSYSYTGMFWGHAVFFFLQGNRVVNLKYIFNLFFLSLCCTCAWFMRLSEPQGQKAGLSILACLM